MLPALLKVHSQVYLPFDVGGQRFDILDEVLLVLLLEQKLIETCKVLDLANDCFQSLVPSNLPIKLLLESAHSSMSI